MRQATRNESVSYRADSRLRDRTRWKLAALVATALLLAASFVGVVEYVSQPDRFPVLEVRLEGDFLHVKQEQLLATVAGHLRGNLFLLDLDAVRQQVEALPWVREASVRREWPHTVQIFFVEQELAAHWNDHLWLNTQGETVDLLGEAGPEGLPLLKGPDGTNAKVLAEFRRFNDIVRAVGLDVAALSLSDQRAWQVQLSNGLDVLLGRRDPEVRLARLMDVYADTVANRVEQIRQLDLRYTNGFSVEWVRATSAPGRNEG